MEILDKLLPFVICVLPLFIEEKFWSLKITIVFIEPSELWDVLLKIGDVRPVPNNRKIAPLIIKRTDSTEKTKSFVLKFLHLASQNVDRAKGHNSSAITNGCWTKTTVTTKIGVAISSKIYVYSYLDLKNNCFDWIFSTESSLRKPTSQFPKKVLGTCVFCSRKYTSGGEGNIHAVNFITEIRILKNANNPIDVNIPEFS